jgi:oxalate decarboxylase/phosphoglucose isomerase-like protein (cupin superfamily)
MNDNFTLQSISLPKILDERGNLSFIEQKNHFPFDIKRVYLVYDVPGGEIRGAHAFKKQHEMIIALSGSFDVLINNSDGTESLMQLNRSYNAIIIPPLNWRTLQNFSTNAVCMVLSSEYYSENDYIRDFNTLVNLRKNNHNESN